MDGIESQSLLDRKITSRKVEIQEWVYIFLEPGVYTEHGDEENRYMHG